MESRNQMTFYVSFWEAINGLPKKDQLPLFRAAVSYGLFGETDEKLTSIQAAVFSLIKPTLNASRIKSANGKQRRSKTKAKPKQTAKENEVEDEVECEVEVEVENENEYLLLSSAAAEDNNKPAEAEAAFERFWNIYPKAVGKSETIAAWNNLNPDPELQQAIMDGLARWKRSEEWAKQGGQYIPRPVNWLTAKRWEDRPTEATPYGATGELGQAELEAISKLLSEEV